jgi:hypothetical protein
MRVIVYLDNALLMEIVEMEDIAKEECALKMIRLLLDLRAMSIGIAMMEILALLTLAVLMANARILKYNVPMEIIVLKVSA